jgi:hypothetical protein
VSEIKIRAPFQVETEVLTIEVLTREVLTGEVLEREKEREPLHDRNAD